MAFIDEHDVLHILDKKIPPGKGDTVNFNNAKLYTTNSIDVPIIVERAKKKGPIILLTAGIHGDEINGVEVVRQIISRKINKPMRGTIICVPIINIFGFLNMSREFPDGRDLNRVFPGSKNGSLASRFAWQFVHEILPVADFCMDFHTGGASRFNAPQIRVKDGQADELKYARIFNAPFTVLSKTITKSYRETCSKKGKPVLLFEGGKTKDSNKYIARRGVEGVMRILQHFEMLSPEFEVSQAERETILIESSRWMRARYSGLLHPRIPVGKHVSKGEYIATITDPYGKLRHKIKAPHQGYILNINESPIVYLGDAIFNLSLSSKKQEKIQLNYE